MDIELDIKGDFSKLSPVKLKKKKSHALAAKQKNAEIIDKSEDPDFKLLPSSYPLLLKNFDKMHVRTTHFTPLENGCAPLCRPIKDYVSSGVINLDKPCNPSSHEVVAWVKRMLKVEKTGHSGTLDPKVSGCLLVCIDRATKLVKSQQTAGKEYVCVFRLHSNVEEPRVIQTLSKLTGPQLQCPPLISAVKRQLRVRVVKTVTLLDLDQTTNLGVFHTACEAGTYVRTMCVHLGLMVSNGCHMQELRRVRSGHHGEEDGLVTLHDVLDAKWEHEHKQDETALRRVIRPLECLLTHQKRVIVKDSSINAICYGAKIMLPGVLRFDSGIGMNDDIVIVSTKGEAVCLAISLMTSSTMVSCDHGVIAKIRRVVMERDVYPRKWGQGPTASLKTRMVKEGLLDTRGRPNEKTPESWLNKYQSYNIKAEKTSSSGSDRPSVSAAAGATLPTGDAATPAPVVKVKTEKRKRVSSGDSEDEAAAAAVADTASDSEKKKKKKKKKKSKKDEEQQEQQTEEAATEAAPLENGEKKKKKKKKKSKDKDNEE